MMWKDSYRIGVERIDRQHIELFRMTEDLVKAVAERAPVEVYQKALGFLTDYVIYHFRDEEDYQASIHYSGMEAHKEEHRQFTQTVLSYETKLRENGFDLGTKKDLAGAVTAWLIYHVADTDQKIVAGAVSAPDESAFDRYVDLFASSALEVMETMTGLDRTKARRQAAEGRTLQGDVFISLALVGDLKGSAVLGFSQELALYLVRAMTMMELSEVDELVQSALCELTNISCGNAATALAGRGLHCDIRPPVLTREAPCGGAPDAVWVETGAGGLTVALCLDSPAQPPRA